MSKDKSVKNIDMYDIKIMDIQRKISGEPSVELIQSIKENGIITPLKLIEGVISYEKRIYVLDGVKRYIACKKARIGQVPVIIEEMTDVEYYQNVIHKALSEMNDKKIPPSLLSELVLLYYSTVMNQGKRYFFEQQWNYHI